VKLKRFLSISLPVLLITFSLITSLPIRVSASHEFEYLDVDLEHLAVHMKDFYGMTVKTMGIVKFFLSIYMYEDFWLAAQTGVAIPVVVRFAGLPPPPENSSIEILGVVEYCALEGGFFYLEAQELRTIPEFPSLIVIPLFIVYE
jgi:hypothetical protein